MAAQPPVRPRWQEREQDRLWQHLLHEDGLFVQRASYFLVAESLLAVAYAALLNEWDHSNTSTARWVAFIGSLLTVFWGVMGVRQLNWFRQLQGEAVEEFDEYKASIRRYESARFNRIFSKMPTFVIMAYFIPSLVLFMWLIFLFRPFRIILNLVVDGDAAK